MNISDLFEKFQQDFMLEELNGELLLEGNCIIWSYSLEDNCEEIPATADDDEDEIIYCFDVASPEELLMENYNKDFELIKQTLDEYEETENWSFSEPEIGEDMISFKIF